MSAVTTQPRNWIIRTVASHSLELRISSFFVECLRVCVLIGMEECVCVLVYKWLGIFSYAYIWAYEYYMYNNYWCVSIKYVGAGEASIHFVKKLTPRRTSGRLSNSYLRMCNMHTFTDFHMYLYFGMRLHLCGHLVGIIAHRYENWNFKNLEKIA